MNRIHSLALVVTLLSPGLVAGCGKKAETSKKAAPTVPAPTAPAPGSTMPAPGSTMPAPAPPTAATDGLKLPQAAHTPGVRWTKVDDLTTAMEITAGDKKIPITSKRHYRDELEILAVDPTGIVTKMKASYPERTDSEVTAGKSRDKPIAIVGKSYVVSSVGGKIEATLADGGAVSPEELAELSHDLDELGKPQPMEHIMSGRTWKVGEVYPFTADELAQLNAVRDTEAPETKALSLTLREVSGDRAVFAMKTSMEVTGKAAMKVELDGAVTVDIKTGRPLALELGGQLVGTVAKMPVTGTMTGTITYAYAAP